MSKKVISIKRYWLPLSLLTVALFMSLAAFLPSLARADEPKVVEIAVNARQWAWDPGVIVVNQGDTVRLKLMATDVTHGFYLDGYGIKAVMEPGKLATVEFVADKSGRWMFRCLETCGNFHPYMIGWLRVKPNWYAGASWLGTGAIGAGFIAFLLMQRVKP
ncbi:MAG TPA: cupredoxin domain-containing protein [Symbiobacteriaceae bacterium]